MDAALMQVAWLCYAKAEYDHKSHRGHSVFRRESCSSRIRVPLNATAMFLMTF